MIALMELGISLTIVVVMIAVGALLMLIGLAVGLITHPLRTLAFLVNKIAALGGGLGLIGTPYDGTPGPDRLDTGIRERHANAETPMRAQGTCGRHVHPRRRGSEERSDEPGKTA